MSNRKLLLADDSITIQKVVNLTFADEGIEVITVGDGDSAMEKFAEFTPDLVMADVNMPGLNGYEVCEIIKQNEDTNRIPVILLVGSFEPFDEAEATRVGANDFLTKPFQSIRQLVNKVTDLLNTNGATKEYSGETESDEEISTPISTSFDETLEMPPEQETSSIDLGDTGMDDEMIETSQVGSLSEEETREETDDDHLKTQALTAEEMSQYNFASNDETLEEISAENDLADASNAEETTDVDETAEEHETENLVVETPELGEVEEPEYVTEEKGFGIVRDEFESSEGIAHDEFESSHVEESADFVETAETETDETTETEAELTATDDETSELTEEETNSMEEPEQTGVAEVESETELKEDVSPMSFDDSDLLELPPLVEETGIRPIAENVQPEPEAQTEPEVQPEQSEPEQPEEVTIHSFSPELIELIVGRVTEIVSERVFRSLAGELVPEVTEQIMKEIAEENLKK